ncbi:hypothetical protein [Crossiella sp. NPDC003009]
MRLDLTDALPTDHPDEVVENAIRTLPTEDLDVAISSLDSSIAAVGSLLCLLPGTFLYSVYNLLIEAHGKLVDVNRVCRETALNLPIALVDARRGIAKQRAEMADGAEAEAAVQAEAEAAEGVPGGDGQTSAQGSAK